MEIAKRIELHTFAVIPTRWVERPFTWLQQCPRLWKSCVRKLNTSLQFGTLVSFSHIDTKILIMLSMFAAGVGIVPLALGHSGATHGGTAVLTWNADPWIVPGMAATSFIYALGIHRLWQNSRRGGGVAVWRAACFTGGMATLMVALLSPVDTLGAELFSMHMVQHELLILIAAPLFVCGRPLAVFVWAFRAGRRKRLVHLVKSRAVRMAWQMLSNPFFAWLVHAVVLWAWHLPRLFRAGLTSDFVHTLQHLSFLASALMFWAALIGQHWRQRSGAAMIYILTTIIHTGMLGALLTFSTSVWYPEYAQTAGAWGLSELEDQQLGGLIMWVPGGFILLIAGMLIAANAIMLDYKFKQPIARRTGH